MTLLGAHKQLGWRSGSGGSSAPTIWRRTIDDVIMRQKRRRGERGVGNKRTKTHTKAKHVHRRIAPLQTRPRCWNTGAIATQYKN
jgi:hypothetical protein